MFNQYPKYTIENTSLNAQYDQHAKNIFRDKSILAYIMIHVIHEFKDYSLEEAIASIEDSIEIATTPVYGQSLPSAIRGLNTESQSANVGRITYDVLFHAWTRQGERKKLIINIEAQKSYYPGYDLVPRGIVYGSRMISDQVDTEFKSPYYDDVKKVYSIWICFNPPVLNDQQQVVSDSIVEYTLHPEIRYPKDTDNVHTGRYDLMSVIFICLGKKGEDSKHQLIGMLSTLFSNQMSIADKKERLNNQYGILVSNEIEEEINTMCNLSENIVEEAWANAWDKAWTEAESKFTEEYNQFKAESEARFVAISAEKDALNAENDALNAENDALNAKNDALNAEIARLQALLAAKE